MAITMQELAEMAGVSRSTVDRALNGRGRVNPKTKNRICQLAESMGYEPDLAAKTLASKSKVFKIGCILNSTGNLFFEDVEKGIHAAASELNAFNVKVITKAVEQLNIPCQLQMIDSLVSEGVQAIAITPLNDPEIARRLNELIADGIAVVALTADIADVNYLSYVGCNHTKSGKITANIAGLISAPDANVLFVLGSKGLLGHDSENVEIKRYGEPVVPEFEIPYHTDIMESFNGIDLESAGKVAGNGFYYLMGDIARLHSAVLSYARDFMIGRGFTYCIPPFMIRSNVVTGVMSFAEMDAMMYKIEGEDLYLIGTSEHSMIGKFIDTMLTEDQLPQTLTSYSPCFRKEKGAHGIEERGIYRIHQFEKQEMIVVCKPEESMKWYDNLWQNTVDLFRSMDIPVRTLECCSGDLADLKVKSCDVEAWSPRQHHLMVAVLGLCSPGTGSL